MTDVKVTLTKPHPYVEVKVGDPYLPTTYRDSFSTQDLDRLDAIINALLKAKDLLEQARRAA